MSWGIAETASDFEKLRAESADYLNGLNSCGLIDYDTYSQAFDFYMDLLQKMYDLGKREEYEKYKWISCLDKLPDKERKTYWVCTDTGYQCECRWTDNIYGFGSIGDKWGWSIFDVPQYSYVVAWRELTESFKRVDDE